MKIALRVITVVVTVATSLLTVPPSAMAASRSVTDGRGDAAAHGDLTRVTYINGDRRVAGRARLADLRRDGSFQLVAAIPNSDVGYAARVWRKPGGGVGSRLVLFTNTQVVRQRCNVTARWKRSADLVTVSFPRTCIEDMPNRLYMAASFRVSGERDYARRAILKRG
jgi:hypothetical protein